MPETKPIYVTAKDLAIHLGLSLSQIRKMTQRRQIPYYDLGRRCVRFVQIEVEEALNQKRVAEYTPEQRKAADRLGL